MHGIDTFSVSGEQTNNLHSLTKTKSHFARVRKGMVSRMTSKHSSLESSERNCLSFMTVGDMICENMLERMEKLNFNADVKFFFSKVLQEIFLAQFRTIIEIVFAHYRRYDTLKYFKGYGFYWIYGND